MFAFKFLQGEKCITDFKQKTFGEKCLQTIPGNALGAQVFWVVFFFKNHPTC